MEQYVTIDGLKIRYRKEQPENADPSLPVLILLHGWGANIDLFDGIFRLAGTRYVTIGMDMPGFGKSEEPKDPPDVDDFADFVLSFIKEVCPEAEKVILLGHSHGGRVIIRLLTRGSVPFEVPKVILVDSAGIVPEKSPAQKRKIGTYHFLKKALVKTGIAERHPEAVDALQKKFGSADYSAASPVMRASMVKCVNTDLREDMPKMKMPVLLIWGEQDTATPISDGRLMEKLMPEAGLAPIAGAGHFTFLDQPVLFGRILASFLHI